jgi:hypothetical protein
MCHGKIKQAITAVHILVGTETCIVGFLPCSIVIWHCQDFIGRTAQIIELCADSEDPVLQQKSNQNFGVASFQMLNDIQQQE